MGNSILRMFLIYTYIFLNSAPSSIAETQAENIYTSTLLQDPPEQVRIIVNTGNVRSGAGTDHTVIITVPLGVILSVIDTEGSWLRVRLTPELGTDADYGCIHDSVVEMVGTKPIDDIDDTEASDEIEESEIKSGDTEIIINNLGVGDAQIDHVNNNLTEQFSAGLTLWMTGGLIPMPTIYYDAGERFTIKGAVGIISEVTILSGEFVYRWQPSSSSGSSVSSEPFLGGSFILLSGDVGYGSFSGVVPFVAGGAFMYLNNHPDWRFQGTVNTILVGTLISVSAAYYF